MRSPLRISPFLRAFEDVWREFPDYRFGQLVINLTRDEEGVFTDPWNWENSEWLRRMEDYVRKNRERGGAVSSGGGSTE